MNRIHFFKVVLLGVVASTPLTGQELRILTWNIESGGNEPAVIAKQLGELGSYDVFALTEVNSLHAGRYRDAIQQAVSMKHSSNYQSVLSSSGGENRMLLLFDLERLHLIDCYELVAHDGIRMNTVQLEYRTPLVARFRQRANGQEFLVVLVHLARGREEVRQMQATGLRTWATAQVLPVFAVGDFNFDFDFASQKGNRSFEIFLAGEVWKWVRPEKLVDTNWYDPEPDGIDNYPNSCLDFTFIAGSAKRMNARSRVIERPGDFPDDDSTSDHRPVELVVEQAQPASAARQQ